MLEKRRSLKSLRSKSLLNSQNIESQSSPKKSVDKDKAKAVLSFFVDSKESDKKEDVVIDETDE